LGWSPRSVYAQLVRGFAERPDGKGGMTACDTWDNAQLHAWVDPSGDGESFPMRLEMKRLAPGETNSWFFEVQGTTGGVRYSTKNPKRLEIFERDATGEQFWKHTDLGFGTPFKTVTGGIFETGFPDIMQQMLAAYLVEREGLLGERFGCVRIEEAVASQRIFAAALNSHHQQSVEHVS
jgi:predicted dehydrogenase